MTALTVQLRSLMIYAALGFTAALCTAFPAAGESSAAPASKESSEEWRGEAEAGLIVTSGNTQSQNVRIRSKAEKEGKRWLHGLSADLIRISEQQQVTAERFTAQARTGYTLTKRSYVFFLARYEDDRFAGYDSRLAESTGYGRKFLYGERSKVEIEGGVGATHTRFVDGTRKSEAILRLAAAAVFPLGATSEFSEEAFTEIGNENVHSESQTSLSARLNAALSMKFNVTVKHNTVVLTGLHKTDTITSVTLLYDF